jgi:hypothetical protein
MFRLFAELNQCRHIYFAGCHDTGYGSLLTPYRGRSDRITLIKAAGFHREFEALDLPIKELPTVFMNTPLLNSKPPTGPAASKAITGTHTSNGTNGLNGTHGTNGIKPVCKHFQKVCICAREVISTREAANTESGYLQVRQ